MDYSINHVWIEAVSLEYGDQITCPIPEVLMTNARNIAKSYPEVPVNIWVDLYGVRNNSSEVITALNDQEDTPNITFKSLDDVPAYTRDQFFMRSRAGEENEHIIWDQVDKARVLTLEHMLRTGHEIVIYSDMDMELTDTEPFERALAILEEHGVVVGRDQSTKDSGIENQFFGFNRDRVNLLPALIDGDSDQKYDGYYDIFLNAFLSFNLAEHGFTSEDVSTPISEITDLGAPVI